jgi:aminoglycoside phosphotransferase (APT) family kinase protein
MPDALAWVETAVGMGVERWTVLRGGMSSAMYRLDLADDAATQLVLRCYVRPDVNEEEPDLASREAAALTVAATADVPTPDLVAVDPNGAAAGVPLVLMSYLPGNVVWDPKAPRPWLTRLAELLPTIHEADPIGDNVGRYFNYEQQSYAPPKWAAKPMVWEHAIELFHGPVPEQARCFIHRDFHPGNVLWRRGKVAGVVDWQSACVGPPSVDIGHCRANFLGYAPELARWFTEVAEQTTGRPFHPWADIAALIGMLDALRRMPPRPAGRQAIEAALDHAVRTLR